MISVTRIGVFYDGVFYNNINKYYRYGHPRRSAISFSGLHAFIEKQVSEKSVAITPLCRIVTAHYFRGRHSAKEARDRPEQLYKDRTFDEILQYHSIQTHYLPLRESGGGIKKEKGVDTLMCLEIFEMAVVSKKLDVVVLITGDSDHTILAKKLHTYGIVTFLLGWNFEYARGVEEESQVTRTSVELQKEVTYSLLMHDIIDEGLKDENPAISKIFLRDEEDHTDDVTAVDDGDVPSPELYGKDQIFDPNIFHSGVILSLKDNYGFIEYPYNNLFFHAGGILGETIFRDLEVGKKVNFKIVLNRQTKREAVEISLATEDESVVKGDE